MNVLKGALGAIGCLLLLSPIAARADRIEVQGRSGLPTVKVGGEKVWIESGNVRMKVVGTNLNTTQEFRLHYPDRNIEKKAEDITVAVREDFYRSRDSKGGEISAAGAKGFSSFGVWVDGRKVTASMDPWEVNSKKDTATRWRYWTIHFEPNQRHSLRIYSAAPLGWEEGKRIVEFVTKDLGHWRGSPDNLEIRLSTPGTTEAHLAGVEPKPNDINSNAVRWVYHKASPNRDIFVQLPAGYAHRSGK